MRLRKVSFAVAFTIALGLSLGACTSSPADPASAPSINVKTNKEFCLLEKENSQDIRAVTLAKAMEDALAKPENKQAVTPQNLTVKKTEEIERQLQAKKCKNVLSLEPEFAETMLQIAKRKPEINFAIMGAVGRAKSIANASSIDFDLRQPAFLAGYAAAGVTKSGKVGAVSDLNPENTSQDKSESPGIETASSWASAFRLGVEYYNQFKGSGITLATWDQSAGGPLQVESAQLREQLLKLADEKVDVIFVMASPGESGAIEGLAAKDAAAIWNGQDLAVSSPQLRGNVLTSTVIDASGCVKQLIKQLESGSISGTDYLGTLKNSGVKLAGWGDYAPRFSDSLTAELAGIRSQIDSGKIDITKLAAHRG